MQNSKINFDKTNLNFSYLINKLANSYDFEFSKVEELKNIEENNNRAFVLNQNDKKMDLLLKRTYYLNEFDKINNLIDNAKKLLERKNDLSKEKYAHLIFLLNILYKLENLTIITKDVYKSLQLQKKIIEIMKNFLMK